MSFNQLRKKISDIISLNQEDHELIEQFFKPLNVEKNVSLIELGKSARQAYFINTGYIRYYKIMHSGEELTIHFFAPNEFAAAINSFFSGAPSEEIMQTLTDCEVLSISADDMEKLYATSQKWQFFGRKLMQGFLIEKEQRIIEQLSLTGQEKYLRLLQTHPDMIRQIQVKYLASFLGMQPESLSRIKKQIN
jgi:CRP/FNR family transcriptional regulator, anaerobic regulatory protein